MNFEQIRHGDHVCFAKSLKDRVVDFPDAQVWDGEPYNCLLEIEQVSDECVAIQCVDNCGMHNIHQITKEEYGEYSSILGESLFRVSSINEYIQANIDDDEVEDYSVEDEIEHILGIILKQCKEQVSGA